MKVLIVCVNYNSYKELVDYLSTIDKAASLASYIEVDVKVADNSQNKEGVGTERFSHINVMVYENDNVGYLGGALKVINQINTRDYDYIIISNVDLSLSEDFFSVLQAFELKDDIAWIATMIYSQEEQRDRNPKIIKRYSKKKLQILYSLYRVPFLYWLYISTAYKRKKLAPKYDEMDIYAGHGSFMLLTKNFFNEYEKLNYPVFLFGEELFLAELIRKKGLKVRYVPTLKVEDNEHVSTSRMKKSFYYKCNQESLKFILDNYYNE